MVISLAVSALAASVSAALVVASPLAASPPAPASGGGLVTSVVVTDIRTANGNTHTELVLTGTLTGTVTGTFVLHRHLVTHPSGNGNTRDVVVTTGSTPCGTGTFETRLAGVIEGGVFEAHGTTIDASGNSANFRSNLDVVGPPGPTFTYSGTYHCH